MENDQSSELKIYVQCKGLQDTHPSVKIDSFMTVKMIEASKAEKQILKTKVYKDNPNPQYNEAARVNYIFYIRQKLLFQVYNFDEPPKFLGSAESTVGQILNSKQNQLQKPLMKEKGKQVGIIIVRAEPSQKSQSKNITLGISFTELKKFRFLCCRPEPNYSFKITRTFQKGELKIYESQAHKEAKKIDFNQTTLSEQKLCKNNEQVNFNLKLYTLFATQKRIGSLQTNLKQIQSKKYFDILNKKDEIIGHCVFRQIKRSWNFQFQDLISAGLQLGLVICIDFSASNIDQKDPKSLHYITQSQKSPYQVALYEVSKVLLDYDSDKLVPLYGFGAKVKMPTYDTQDKVSDCFPLNGNMDNAYVLKVEGIMKAYRQALPFLKFDGPTYYGILLNEAMNTARNKKASNTEYMILFILTDGQLHDKKQEIIDQIIECSFLPISLIIVGLGKQDFSFERSLCDYEKLTHSKGKKARRDFVHFVEFNKNDKKDQYQLASKILEKLPKQIRDYYDLNDITPEMIKKCKDENKAKNPKPISSTEIKNQSTSPQKGNPRRKIF